ncbi:MAG: hypothetical protein ABIU63_08740 [Chitinophagaceae bacterium]
MDDSISLGFVIIDASDAAACPNHVAPAFCEACATLRFIAKTILMRLSSIVRHLKISETVPISYNYSWLETCKMPLQTVAKIASVQVCDAREAPSPSHRWPPNFHKTPSIYISVLCTSFLIAYAKETQEGTGA